MHPRSISLAWRLLARDRTRFGITVTGVGAVVLLLLLLGAIYEGLKSESNGYVRERPVSVWVAQNNTNNFLRSSSYLRAWHADSIAALPGVAQVTPMLRLVSTAGTPAGTGTMFLVGYPPGAVAAEPHLVAGRQVADSGEIVLDRAYARRFGLLVGDTIHVQGKRFRVTGLSKGTNAVMVQFAFISLADAMDLAGIRTIVSFLLVEGLPGEPPDSIVMRVRRQGGRVNAFTQNQFVANNQAELQAGLMPILAAVDVSTALVGAMVLALLLYSAVSERREDYALLKALGARDSMLRTSVITQALLAMALGSATGLLAYLIVAPLVPRFVPQIVLGLSPAVVGVALGFALAMALVGAILPVARLQRLYPAELFRA